jgi:hypothetical protein
MSNKIANGSTRYTAVFAHVTIVSFGLWCVGQLISARDIDFQKNTIKTMLGFGLLLIVCGSLFVHEFSSASTENAAEDTSTSMTKFHSILGYSLIVIAIIYILVQVCWKKKGIKMAGVTVSILVCLLATTGYDVMVGSCGDRYVISHNHGQPVYTRNPPTFCVSHFFYEFQGLIFLALGSYYNTISLWRHKEGNTNVEGSIEKSDKDVEWTECIALMWFSVCNLTFFIVSKSIQGYDAGLRSDTRLILAGAISGGIMMFFNGICVLSWSCSLFGFECVGAKFRSFSSFISFISHGLAVLILFYQDLKSSIYYFEKDEPIGALQQTAISIFGFSVMFQAFAKLSQVLIKNCFLRYCADGTQQNKHGVSVTLSNILIKTNAIMTYAAGFAILFAQPTGAAYLVKELKFDYVGISWFIIFLALLMYGQDILSSWLVGKLMLGQQGIVKNRSAGRYNKIEMTDIGTDSYEKAEEDNDGSDVQQIADNATV